MKRWVVISGAALLGFVASFVIPPAHAAIDVCAAIRANSEGTFLKLDQQLCQSAGIPQLPTTLLGVLPNPLPPIPYDSLPPLPIPPIEGAPAQPGQDGEVCAGINYDVPGTDLVGIVAPCFGFDVPPLPLPEVITYPDLPPLPVPIPALPVPIPSPVPLPLP